MIWKRPSGGLSLEAGAVVRVAVRQRWADTTGRLAAFDREDLHWFADHEGFEPASERTGKPGITRYLHLMPELMMVLGGYLSAGSGRAARQHRPSNVRSSGE